MRIVIGRIVNNSGLKGLRVYNSDTDKIMEATIESCIRIKNQLKNMNNINRLDIIGGTKTQIILDKKRGKYKTIDSTGRIHIILSEDINKFNMVNTKSNVELYKEYITKLSLIGEEPDFVFNINKDEDEVIVGTYINRGKNVIELPSFVTNVADYVFAFIKNNLKVVHKYNQIKDMQSLFENFDGKELDLSQFDTTGASDMQGMFFNCTLLEKLNISNFNTSTVFDMNSMFKSCSSLKELNVSSFDTKEVGDMYEMFCECSSLRELDLSNFEIGDYTDIGGILRNTRLTYNSTGLKVGEKIGKKKTSNNR